MNYLKNWNNMDTKDFEMKIQPFFWVDHESTASVCLNVGEYKAEIFEVPELSDKIDFDSESSMFCAYSKDKEALKSFILQFKEACENHVLIMDLFFRAELD